MALGERARNPFAPRSTAEAAASVRAAGALEADPAVRCPDTLAAGFLGGFNVTSLARHRLTQPLYVRVVNRKNPGAYGYNVARCKAIDEILLAELEAGLDEVVVLGAGLDSLAYRHAEALREVRVLEVDHPASQASKRAKLERLFGTVPEHVRFVALDFTGDDLRERLAEAGHDGSARTLFIWSGVSMYLPEGSVAELLRWVAAHGNARTSIVLDVCWAEAIDRSREYFGAPELLEGFEAIGEPLRWGIPEGRIEETLARYGLAVEAAYGPDELAARYLVREDGSILGRPFGFFAVVHARPAPGGSARSSRRGSLAAVNR